MLEANKSKWFEKVFAVYNRNLLKRRFHSLNVLGLDSFEKRNKNFPLIIYINHSSWWDGLVIFEILKRFDFENYVMMEEKQLKKLWLFRKLGAFSVIRENPREAVKSIIYATSKLKNNAQTTLVIFPQGKIFPNDLRPIKFYSGVSRIVEKVKICNILPIGFRYESINYFKPQIFVNIGEMNFINTDENFNYKTFTNDLELDMTKLLDNLKDNVINNKIDDFENLL